MADSLTEEEKLRIENIELKIFLASRELKDCQNKIEELTRLRAQNQQAIMVAHNMSPGDGVDGSGNIIRKLPEKE